jgi:peptidyl-tRNA hydrolase, PTH1 family
MKFICGLGNPGDKYAFTRHNFGFRAVDAFRVRQNFSAWRIEKKFKAEISDGKIGQEKVLLVRPQTFMNLSGESILALLNFYKPHRNDFLVIFDDIDLPFGSVRMRERGSSGGHNGVKSLIKYFGTNDFARLKLGVGNELLDVVPTEEFVLMKFAPDEEKMMMSKILEEAVEKIENFFKF